MRRVGVNVRGGVDRRLNFLMVTDPRPGWGNGR